MAVDILIRQLAATGRVNVEGVVRRIRQQRAFSVQTAEQYMFVYTALIRYAQTHGMIDTSNLQGI